MCSISCLYPQDELSAKKSFGMEFILYFLFTSYHLGTAKALSTSTYTMETDGTTTEKINVSGIIVPNIYPFYADLENLKLNISWDGFIAPGIERFNISSNRIGPQENQKCRPNASEYFKVINDNTSYIIIPEENITNSILVSECMYRIEISAGENIIMNFSYTIPGTSIVEDIEASAFWTESGEIHLNVSWKNPTEPLLPTEYHIMIDPDKEGTEYCKNHSASQETYVKANLTSTLITEKEVLPNCSYIIKIEEQPANDRTAPKINYTVPACKEKQCMCLRPQPPIINVKQKTLSIITVTWKIPTCNMANITAIKFSVSQLSLQLHSKTYDITDQVEGANRTEDIIIIPEMKPGALYSIEAWYINASNYKSQPAHLFYTAQAVLELQTGHLNTSSQIVLTIFITLTVLLLIMCFLRRRIFLFYSQWLCDWICNRNIHAGHQIRRIYQPTTGGHPNRPYLSVPMEFNNLYIEKEIADEQERGKVDRYEISYNRLEFGNEIGKGAFGKVFLARTTAIPGYTTVAVKKLDDSLVINSQTTEFATPEEEEEFLQEIEMLKQTGRHPNIVTLLGCCILRQPYCMVMEYLPFGDLLHYLRVLRLQYEHKEKTFLFSANRNFNSNRCSNEDKHKFSDASYIIPESFPSKRLPSETETEYTLLGSDMGEPSTSRSTPSPNHSILECVLDPCELQNFALQISRGMQHLESKSIVHRDLAARNVLISENKVLKISDFGLSRRGIYVNSKQKKVPLRWLSVEAIRDNKYTNKSDVWAYGVVLWEIGTLGGFPYPTVADNEMLPNLLNGKRLEKPENCTDELYDLMQQCWSHSEDQRPSFSQLVDRLETISNKRHVYVDFSQLNPLYVFPPTEEQKSTQINTENNISNTEIILADSER